MAPWFSSRTELREDLPLLHETHEVRSKVVTQSRILTQSKIMAVFVGWLLKDAVSMTLGALVFGDRVSFAKESTIAEDTSRPSWEFIIYVAMVIAGAFCATEIERLPSWGSVSKVPFVTGFNFMPAWALKSFVSTMAAKSTAATSYDYIGNLAVQFMVMYVTIVCACLVQYAAKNGEAHHRQEGFPYHVFLMTELSLALSVGFTVDNFTTQGLFPLHVHTLPFVCMYVVAGSLGCALAKAKISQWKTEHEASLGPLRSTAINLLISSTLFVMAWSWEHFLDYFMTDDKLAVEACIVTGIGFVATGLSAVYGFQEELVMGIAGLNIAWAWMDYLAVAVTTEMTLVELWCMVIVVCLGIAVLTAAVEKLLARVHGESHAMSVSLA